jgi:hypothetical protein
MMIILDKLDADFVPFFRFIMERLDMTKGRRDLLAGDLVHLVL